MNLQIKIYFEDILSSDIQGFNWIVSHSKWFKKKKIMKQFRKFDAKLII